MRLDSRVVGAVKQSMASFESTQQAKQDSLVSSYGRVTVHYIYNLDASTRELTSTLRAPHRAQF